MKFKKIIILSLLFISIFNSCLKEKTKREMEDLKILAFIDQLNVPFDTLPSGVILHVYYKGIGDLFKKGDSVTITYSAYNLDKATYLITDDTIKFIVGSRDLLSGWSEVLQNVGRGGNGVAIFPYYIAFGENQTSLVPQNTTIVFYFQVTSSSYIVNQNALFWAYADKFYSTREIFPDSLCYVQYFEGEGPQVTSAGVHVDYSLVTIAGDTIEQNYDKTIDFNDANLCYGFKEALLTMKQGEMGKIIIPPDLAYTDINVFGLLPFTSIYAETRIKADNYKYEENSKINKHLYLNNKTADSTLSNGIIMLKYISAALEATQVISGSTITLTDTLEIIDENTIVDSSQNRTKVVNTSYFTLWQMECLKMMRQGEVKNFIIPYSVAYGSSGSGSIPPYATLVYKVKIIKVE